MMTPEQIVATAKQILAAPPQAFAPGMLAGMHSESVDAVEKLIRTVALFLSMDDTKLRNAILAEAQNRIFVAGAAGKKPWEM